MCSVRPLGPLLRSWNSILVWHNGAIGAANGSFSLQCGAIHYQMQPDGKPRHNLWNDLSGHLSNNMKACNCDGLWGDWRPGDAESVNHSVPLEIPHHSLVGSECRAVAPLVARSAACGPQWRSNNADDSRWRRSRG